MNYLDRDLSWLSFNYRVLQEAMDEKVPMYERIHFLAIYSSNLDEFFRVRYPTIVALSELNSAKTSSKASKKQKILEQVQRVINLQMHTFYRTLTHSIIPQLERHKILFYFHENYDTEHLNQTKAIFLGDVLSFIQPIILGTERSKNFVPENNKLYFVISVVNKSMGGVLQHVIVNIPSDKLPRLYVLQPNRAYKYVTFIDDVIRNNINFIFPNSEIIGVYSIMLNRDAELNIVDNYSDKMIESLERQLSKREVGIPSRFLYEEGMPVSLQIYLANLFKVKLTDMYAGGRYHHLSDLMKFPVFNKKQLYPKQKQIVYPLATVNGEIFDTVQHHDVLLHFPYDSYIPILAFFNQAAIDPSVKEIFITLYRVAAESHIVNALISAANNGKKVTCFIELKARFDEANNIKWSRMMKRAGIKLIYSEVAIKVHSKTALIKRTINGVESNLGMIATGNFNENTAVLYTDHALLTADKEVCNELNKVFQILQHRLADYKLLKPEFKRLYVTQFNLVPEFYKLIHKEIKKAKEGKPALIRIKVNNLEEKEFINELYKASEAGVKVQLLTRSICCLNPNQQPYSENITAKRIVGRYLEHSRIFIFGAIDEAATVIIGSTDLMIRNLKRRIEVCVSVSDEACRKQLLEYFTIQWADNVKATYITDDYENKKVLTNRSKKIIAQESIYQYLENVQRNTGEIVKENDVID